MQQLLRFAIMLSWLFTTSALASGVMSQEQMASINKAALEAEQLSKVAGYLAEYEIEAKKLIKGLDTVKLAQLNNQATDLINLAQGVISSAKFRLPQCEAYLTKTLALKQQINTISDETIERDYHHDGVLPEAAPECYHTKDLFIHPATVLIHTRDHPDLSKPTKEAIHGEIAEVLAHLEQVRSMVVYE